MKSKINEYNGVTIITLVITIIVLLILAGVSINLVFNSDGLFKKASSGTENYKQKKAEEALTLTLQEAQMIKYSEGLDDIKLNKMINKIGKVDDVSNTLITVETYVFLIDRNVPKIVKCVGTSNEIKPGDSNNPEGNEDDNSTENDKNLSNKIIMMIPTEGMTLKFGINKLSSELNVNQYSYNITPTEGIQNDKVTGTFKEGEIVEVPSTKAETYTITINAINDKGDKIALANTKMTTQDIPSKGETPPERGWTIEQAKKLLARDGLKAHIGEKVDYNPKAKGTWRIFYYDNQDDGKGNGYFGLTGTLYLKRDFENTPVDIETHKGHVSSDNGTIMGKMNPKWKNSQNSSSIDLVNEKAVSWLCDTKEWEDYKEERVANFAIGSPSLEMYIKAYNEWLAKENFLICDIYNACGYKIGWNGAYTDAPWNAPDGILQEGPNNIFIEPQQGRYWLCSPQADLRQNIMWYATSDLKSIKASTINPNYCVCPIASLK